MAVACPVCAKDDAIQKVSAVVASGQATGTFSGPTGGITDVGGQWGIIGGFSSLSGEMRTRLAQALAASREPSGPVFRPRGRAAWCMSVLMSLLFGGVALFGVFGIVMSVASGDGGGIVMGLLMVGVGGPKAWYCWVEPAYRQEEWKKLSEQRAAWHVAMTRWERLYYCYRDDTVFDPQRGETCQPAAKNEL